MNSPQKYLKEWNNTSVKDEVAHMNITSEKVLKDLISNVLQYQKYK